jgi:transaldolase/glucose-6-phosphate isomerase
MEANLGDYQAAVDQALAEMSDKDVLARIWDHDHTVWKPEPAEISNRLGWLHSPKTMGDEIAGLESLAKDVRAEGYTDVLLLGMGGSSLAPELFHKVFGGQQRDHLNVAVLDSTVPGVVLAHAERLDPAHTLFIVSSKSGTTLETLSFFKFFYNRTLDRVGQQQVGKHFVAITDPDTHLAQLGEQLNFRATLINDPDIGGRYSALSFFGLLPAALSGVDLARLLQRASEMADANQPAASDGHVPALELGASLAELAKQGRDKATFIITSPVHSFGDWVEQLIAESLGKEGHGVLPVVNEPWGLSKAYSEDRFFVYLRLDEHAEEEQDELVQAYQVAGFPVLRQHMRDIYDLGGQFFVWELAVAVAGHRLGINPFDQPNVEAAKRRAKDMVASYTQAGKLPDEMPSLTDGDIVVYSSAPEGAADAVATATAADQALIAFVEQAETGAYLALQAYLQPTVEVDAALRSLVARLRDRTRLATTLGYGPRYLHSTGQLHKGDAGRGLFIQFTAQDAADTPIPDEAGSSGSSVSFGVLKTAQALGDQRALLDAGRRVIRFHLGKEVVAGLNRLGDALV